MTSKVLLCLWLGLGACVGGSGGGGSAAGEVPSETGSVASPIGGSFLVNTNGKIGEFALKIPASDPFTLRGTMPVPKGFLKNSQEWLAVLNPDGSAVPVQMETVTRYPTGEPAVVELIARVNRYSLPPEAKASYDVVTIQYTSGTPPKSGPVQNVPAEIATLVKSKRDLMVAARDCHGNLYLFAPFSVPNHTEDLSNGPYRHVFRTYGRLKPETSVSGPNGTAAHLLGVHAYIGEHAEENVLTVDLRFNNGMVAASPEMQQPISKTYFQEILLLLPDGYTALQDIVDPFFGGTQSLTVNNKDYSAISIVKPLGSGKMHVMGPMAQFHRRLAVTTLGSEARAQAVLDEEGLSFSRPGVNSGNGQPLCSWWNPQTSNYFPQRDLLPSLAYQGTGTLQTKLKNSYNNNKNVISSGPANYPSYPWSGSSMGSLGWAKPWGAKYGGMTGGQEIHFVDGMEVAECGSTVGYLDMRLAHRSKTDRQPDALYNGNGTPIGISQLKSIHPQGYSYIPFSWFLIPQGLGANYFQLNAPPTPHESYVANNGLKPPYEDELLAFLPIDLQHFVRYTGTAKALVWLGNDPIAKDDLELQANLARLSRPEIYTSSNKAVTGLLSDMKFVTANPGIGTNFGRGEGWGMDVNNALYAFADDAKRAELKPWLDMNVDAIALGQVSCTGVIQAHVPSKYPTNFMANSRMRQHFEDSIVGPHALWGMLSSVYLGTQESREATLGAVIERNCRSFIHPVAWKANAGPWKYLATGSTNLSLPIFCTLPMPSSTQQGIDNYQTSLPLARGYLLTGDTEFISKASEMFGGMGPMQTALQATSGSKQNLPNDYLLLFAMQQLGWTQP